MKFFEAAEKAREGQTITHPYGYYLIWNNLKGRLEHEKDNFPFVPHITNDLLDNNDWEIKA